MEKKCGYFSWINLNARDKWRQEHGSDKRDSRLRTGIKEERRSHRRNENLKILTTTDIPWIWVDEKSGHVCIGEYIDYYLGSTSYVVRATREQGYRMLKSLLTDYERFKAESDAILLAKAHRRLEIHLVDGELSLLNFKEAKFVLFALRFSEITYVAVTRSDDINTFIFLFDSLDCEKFHYLTDKCNRFFTNTNFAEPLYAILPKSKVDMNELHIKALFIPSKGETNAN